MRGPLLVFKARRGTMATDLSDLKMSRREPGTERASSVIAELVKKN